MKPSGRRGRTVAMFISVPLALLASACGSDEPPSDGLQGAILLDGSSTVAPLMTLTAADFHDVHSGVKVTVNTSGTGGGFEKFCRGETDVSDASRPINDAEAAACEAAGIDFQEVLIANDALSVVVNPDNDWAECLTVEQLHRIWAPESEGTITKWNQIDPSFPDQTLDLYGAGTESGTFDYFTTVINGAAGSSRTDYSATEDDNVTVAGVAGSTGALGYFGFSYLEVNLDKVKVVAIDSGGGCVEPSAQAVAAGTYTPLSRPLYMYIKTAAVARAEVRAFLEYYVANQDSLTYDALFVPLSDTQKSVEQAGQVAAIVG